MFRCLLFISIFFALCVQAQTGIEAQAKVERKSKNWDTTKYQKFETVLIVGWITQQRTFSNEFDQLMNVDTLNLSRHTYSTETDAVGAQGLVLSYDKFQLSLTYSPKPPDNNSGKGHTELFNIGLNVGDNRWVLENYYRRFKGFYDNNTPDYDSAKFNKTKQYYLQPHMISSLFMTRFSHFLNYKKFAYKAGFGCNYRQYKSAGSFILGGSFSKYSLRNDSSIIPLKARNLYNEFGGMKGMSSVNTSANVGIAGSLVFFKAWFINIYGTWGPEIQWRNYYLNGNYRKLTYVGSSRTLRASLGLNLKKFYWVLSYSYDVNMYNSGALKFKTVSHTGNTTFGWRFHCKTPKFYQNFMKSKLYNLL